MVMDEHHKKEPSLQDANHPANDSQEIRPSKLSLLVCSHEATDQLHNNDKLHTIKIATLRHIPKTRVNIFQDDTWGWELVGLYVAHREVVTNRLVPNLAINSRIGNRAFCKCLITSLLRNGWCRTSWAGDRKTKKPAPKGWLAV